MGKAIPATPVEAKTPRLDLIVEPSEEWLREVASSDQVKFVRRGRIVLAAIATEKIDHMAIYHGLRELIADHTHGQTDTVEDSGYLLIDRLNDPIRSVKVERFSSTYWRGDQGARKLTASILRDYLPNFIITTDDETNIN